MILVWIIVILLAGGLLSWLAGRRSAEASRWVALVATLAALALILNLWRQTPDPLLLTGSGRMWLAEVRVPWIPQLGITFHLALDGLSLLMLLLTAFLGAIAVLTSWKSIQERVGFFHMNLLFTLAGVAGVFLALDLFLFFFFWELMLIPMFFLIDIWGYERRHYAAVKFFIFTQLSGLLMLLAMLGLYFAHHAVTGAYTFDYADLLGTPVGGATAMWLMLGFFVAFAVKLPVVPLHTWLPDAHTEAPTAGSVLLAGLLLKTGAYGMIRFVVPLFPEAAARFAPVAMVLAVIGILYGAVLAFGQRDLKRLVAYTSVSHLGFVLLGIFAWNALSVQGAVMEMICHGLSTGALFVLAGQLQERLHTRDMDRLGGLWTMAPRMGAAALFFALASLGLPGLGNFVAEFLVLVGTFPVTRALTALATIGLLFATIYSIWIVVRAFFGPEREKWQMPDLRPREVLIMAALAAVLLWLGLYPQPVLNTAQPAVHGMFRTAGRGERSFGVHLTPSPSPGRRGEYAGLGNTGMVGLSAMPTPPSLPGKGVGGLGGPRRGPTGAGIKETSNLPSASECGEPVNIAKFASAEMPLTVIPTMLQLPAPTPALPRSCLAREGVTDLSLPSLAQRSGAGEGPGVGAGSAHLTPGLQRPFRAHLTPSPSPGRRGEYAGLGNTGMVGLSAMPTPPSLPGKGVGGLGTTGGRP